MNWQSGSNGRGGPRGIGTRSGSETDDLIRQGKERINEILQTGGPRKMIFFGLIGLVILGAWTAYYTVPSDSVAVLQRFGKYLKEVPPGLHSSYPWE